MVASCDEVWAPRPQAPTARPWWAHYWTLYRVVHEAGQIHHRERARPRLSNKRHLSIFDHAGSDFNLDRPCAFSHPHLDPPPPHGPSGPTIRHNASESIEFRRAVKWRVEPLHVRPTRGPSALRRRKQPHAMKWDLSIACAICPVLTMPGLTSTSTMSARSGTLSMKVAFVAAPTTSRVDWTSTSTTRS